MTASKEASMTRRANARLAGFSFLFYLTGGITQLVLDRATRAEGVAATLALVAEHASSVRVSMLLGLLLCLNALALAVALYAITHEEDRDLAVVALSCRVGEALLPL